MIYLLSQILDASAARFPEQDAFCCDGEAITYKTLLRRANGLAHWLVEQGVQRGDRVGIYMSQRLESAIAIYGIWKAGAAYVPLDPNAPIKRLAYVMQDCDIRYLITHPSKRRQLPELLAETPEVECVLGLPDSFSLEGSSGTHIGERSHQPPIRRSTWSSLSERETFPQIQLLDQDLAYILYTSGSTGIPKGIMHSHYSGLSYARLAVKTYDLTQCDRLGNHSPLHFDISTLGFFAGPLAGATTVIVPEAYTKLPASLSQLIQDEELTVWYSVPLALSQLWLRGALVERDLAALRWVLFAGEPFPSKYLYAWMKYLPEARFSNIYGPTEVNQCTYYHVPTLPEGSPVPEENVPIGQVWDNSEGLIVDDEDQPVAAGEVGELLVRTPTMMSGYWKRPDLNGRAFYHCEIADQKAVFYRTGDLVRQQPDAQYQFIGRKDRQVKIRGYRVELDGIEAALVSHPHVEESATYAVLDPSEPELNQQVQASVILKSGAELDETVLKQHISKRVPAYAMPATIEILTHFPRTATGKIDRRALQQQAEVRGSP